MSDPQNEISFKEKIKTKKNFLQGFLRSSWEDALLSVKLFLKHGNSNKRRV